MAKSRETSWGRTELIEQGVERTGTQAGAYMYPLRQPGQQSVSPRNSRATTRQQANRNKWARWDIRSTIEVFGERKRPASAEWLSAHDARTLLSVCAIRVTPTSCLTVSAIRRRGAHRPTPRSRPGVLRSHGPPGDTARARYTLHPVAPGR
jgi:hypothetical protein